MSMDIEQLLKDMTLEEKASLCSGHDFWHTKTVERLGIPAVMMCDGPNGLRKQEGPPGYQREYQGGLLPHVLRGGGQL